MTKQTTFEAIDPRVAVYIRVSGKDQSYDSQVHAIREFCRRRGWKKIKVYHEKKPGAKAARSEFERLLRDMRAELIDVIVIFKIARFGRSMLHLLQTIEELKSRKIPLISISEGIDTSSDDAKTKYYLIGLAQNAEFFRDNLSDNVKAGHAAARARGVHIGRPPTDPAIIAKVLKLRAAKKSFAAIGKAVGMHESNALRIYKTHAKT